MPATLRPMRITPRAEKLQNALAGRKNQWFTRHDVARLVGKKRLTPHEIDLLHLLGEKGRIRIRQEEGYSRDGYRWLYGVFDDDRSRPTQP